MDGRHENKQLLNNCGKKRHGANDCYRKQQGVLEKAGAGGSRPVQCELVGREADGEPVPAAAIALNGITIEGHALQPVPHSQPIRYLGVQCCFDGSWHGGRSRTRRAR
jgi:hypothetical protein